MQRAYESELKEWLRCSCEGGRAIKQALTSHLEGVMSTGRWPAADGAGVLVWDGNLSVRREMKVRRQREVFAGNPTRSPTEQSNHNQLHHHVPFPVPTAKSELRHEHTGVRICA